MNSFETLFGIKSTQIQKNCILTPFLTKNLLKSLDIKSLIKGKLYSCGNNAHLTLILTGIGAPFVGDSVLYLKDTPCQDIFFFGSCGLIKSTKTLSIGSLISPSSCLAVDSFSQILNHDFNSTSQSLAHETLLKKFTQQDFSKDIQNIPCASLGSLKLEEDTLEFLKKNKISAVDMECSAFFHAATKIKRRALALLYVTDIIKEKPFYIEKSSFDKTAIDTAIKKSIHALCNLSIQIT